MAPSCQNGSVTTTLAESLVVVVRPLEMDSPKGLDKTALRANKVQLAPCRQGPPRLTFAAGPLSYGDCPIVRTRGGVWFPVSADGWRGGPSLVKRPSSSESANMNPLSSLFPLACNFAKRTVRGPAGPAVVCPADATPRMKLAAQELRRYVYLRTGKLLAVAETGTGIALGIDPRSIRSSTG